MAVKADKQQIAVNQKIVRWGEGIFQGYRQHFSRPVQVADVEQAQLAVAGLIVDFILDEEKVFRNLTDPKMQNQIAEQQAALDGKRGALLWTVSTEDGAKLGAFDLASPPVFDGMAAARGKLYVSTMDGKVRCLGGNE